MTISEAQFFEQVRDLLNLYGWRWYHTHDSRRSNAGFPDLVAVRPPRLLFAELKTQSRGRVSVAQRCWLDALRECQTWMAPEVEVYLWRPSDLSGIAGVLR